MSTQTHDLPDFFHGDQWANPSPFIDEINVQHGSAPVTFGPFNMAGWEGLVVAMKSADALLCFVNWFGDPEATIFVGQQVFEALPNVSYLDVLPALGVACTVTVTFHTGAGTVNTTTVICPRKGLTPWARPIADLVMMHDTAHNIGAGVTLNVPPLFVATGEASLVVTTNAAAWTAVLTYTDGNGVTIAPLAVLNATATPFGGAQRFFLPAHPINLAITNNDGVARGFGYSVVLNRF